MQDPTQLKRKDHKTVTVFEDGVRYSSDEITQLKKLTGPNKKQMLIAAHALKSILGGRITSVEKI